MEPISWRKLEEATADMAKSLWSSYKELRKKGFSRRQAFKLTKLFAHTFYKGMIDK